MKTKEELLSLGIEESKVDQIMMLEKKMASGKVKFQYTKKDGTLREAIGTTCNDLMEQIDGTLWTPSEKTVKKSSTSIPYFDCEKGLWRSFMCTNFNSIIE